MNYLAPSLRLGIRPDCPSIDAAACLADRISAAESDAREQAQDVAAARWAVDAIKQIAAIDLTPAVCAQIAAVLSDRVAHASWAHFATVEDALADLDNAVDTLAALGRAE